MSPVYLLEHLATFTVSPENDLVYPADGMRRLLAMEKTNGIWTQKMMMRIQRKMVNIMDHENKEIVEQFPLGEQVLTDWKIFRQFRQFWLNFFKALG